MSSQPDYDEMEELSTLEDTPALGVHAVLMTDGKFALTATGEPNLGEMYMILARALKSVEARMVGETVAQLMTQEKSRIITPGR